MLYMVLSTNPQLPVLALPPPDCATQLRSPEPFVLNTCPLLPPVIVTLPTAPKSLEPVTLKLPGFKLP